MGARRIRPASSRLGRREALAFLGAGVGLGVVAACSPATTGGTAPGGTASAGTSTTSGPRRGGELTVSGLTFGENGGDPHGLAVVSSTSDHILSAVMEGLFELDKDANVVPVLAESHDVSSDGLTYSFNIRKGVTFHNGRALTADDIEYSFARMRDPATNHPARKTYDIIESMKATGTSTAVMRLKAANAGFLSVLTDVRASIVPKEEVAKGKFQEHPVGTGPFKFVEFIADEHTQFARHPSYWRPGIPYVDSIRGVATGDVDASSLMLQAGQVDYLRDGDATKYLTLSKDANYVTYTGAAPTYSWLVLDPRRVPAFRDPRVRQALSMAIDRKALSSAANPLSTPLYTGFLPANHWAATKESHPWYTYDPDQAKKLLADAGQSDLRFELWSAQSGHFGLAASFVQQAWKSIGVQTQQQKWVSVFKDLGAVKADAGIHGTSGTADPDSQYAVSYLPGGGRNVTEWNDPDLNDLVRRAQLENKQAERAKLYRQAEKIVIERGPYLFLYNYSKYDVGQKYVKGVVYNAQSKHWREIRDYWLDK